MRDTIFILVFSVVLLFFSIFPAIKIADYIDKHKQITQKQYNFLTILFTILISLIGGIFLRYF